MIKYVGTVFGLTRYEMLKVFPQVFASQNEDMAHTLAMYMVDAADEYDDHKGEDVMRLWGIPENDWYPILCRAKQISGWRPRRSVRWHVADCPVMSKWIVFMAMTYGIVCRDRRRQSILYDASDQVSE